MTSRMITIVPFFLLMAAGEPAKAGAASHLVEFRFEMGELASPGGAERVYRRLSREAQSACVTSGRKSLREAAIERACADGLVAELIGKIGDAGLAAVHAEELGDRPAAGR